MTENEKRILTLLAARGPMSHQELQIQGNMGWATVIKNVTRLSQSGLLKMVGTRIPTPNRRGKREFLYDLASDYPLAIGIDFEHQMTTAAILTLNGSRVYESQQDSPDRNDLENVEEFLYRLVKETLETDNAFTDKVVGIGIGLPRLELVSQNSDHHKLSAQILERNLSNRLGRRVRIDGNVRAYALYENWKNGFAASGDFLLVSVRGGLGLAVYTDGELLTGQPGYPGALAHVRVAPDHRSCWCGRSGCVETVVSERFFGDRFNQIAQAGSTAPFRAERNRAQEYTRNLFKLAARGNSEAFAVLEESAYYLSIAISPVIAATSVKEALISGHFSSGGPLYASLIESQVRARLLPELDVRFRYLALDDQGFTSGAALLVLNDYLTAIPSPKAERRMFVNEVAT